VVMIRGGRVKDLPACANQFSAVLDTQGVQERKQRRSKYGGSVRSNREQPRCLVAILLKA